MALTAPLDTLIANIEIRSEERIIFSGVDGVNLSRKAGRQRWAGTLSYKSLTLDEARDIEAITALNRVNQNAYSVRMPHNYTPRGAWPVLPSVATALRFVGNNSTVYSEGFSAWTSNVVRKGDLLQFAGDTKVYMVVSDAGSDGVGGALLAIYPPMENGPSFPMAINARDVTFSMHITNDSVSQNIDAPELYDVIFNWSEVL